MVQSTLKKPAVKNLRIAVCMQYTLGLMVYYGVSIAGYWIYGSNVPEYLPKAISGPKWAKVLINSAVFLQNVISQHVRVIFATYYSTVTLTLLNYFDFKKMPDHNYIILDKSLDRRGVKE